MTLFLLLFLFSTNTILFIFRFFFFFFKIKLLLMLSYFFSFYISLLIYTTFLFTTPFSFPNLPPLFSLNSINIYIYQNKIEGHGKIVQECCLCLESFVGWCPIEKFLHDDKDGFCPTCTPHTPTYTHIHPHTPTYTHIHPHTPT